MLWKHLINLKNPHTAIEVSDVEITFSSEQKTHKKTSNQQIKLKTPNNGDEKIPYNVVAKNISNSTYFCSCLIATENYGVFVSTHNLKLEPSKELELIHYRYAAFELSNNNENLAINYIKIFLSKDTIKTIPLLELNELTVNSDFKPMKKKGVTSRKNDIEGDWVTKTIVVKIIRDVEL